MTKPIIEKSKKTLLVFDIGNTNIKVALVTFPKIEKPFDFQKLFSELQIEQVWRISSSEKRTGDEYFALLRPLFREAAIDSSSIIGAVLSSVVPSLIGAFVKVSEYITGKKPLIIASDIYEKLPIKLPAQAVSEIGSDLLCNALAAFSLFGKEKSIICDFGTAMSFVALSDGVIKGVAIAPGLQTAVNSLFSGTAQLPQVSLIAPPSVLGKNTVTAIQAGVVLGFRHLVDGLITQMKKALLSEENSSDLQNKKSTPNPADLQSTKSSQNFVNSQSSQDLQNASNPADLQSTQDLQNAPNSAPVVHTIATGGLNSTLSSITNIFETIDKDLTVKGIAMAYWYTSLL